VLTRVDNQIEAHLPRKLATSAALIFRVI